MARQGFTRPQDLYSKSCSPVFQWSPDLLNIKCPLFARKVRGSGIRVTLSAGLSGARSAHGRSPLGREHYRLLGSISC